MTRVPLRLVTLLVVVISLAVLVGQQHFFRRALQDTEQRVSELLLEQGRFLVAEIRHIYLRSWYLWEDLDWNEELHAIIPEYSIARLTIVDASRQVIADTRLPPTVTPAWWQDDAAWKKAESGIPACGALHFTPDEGYTKRAFVPVTDLLDLEPVVLIMEAMPTPFTNLQAEARGFWFGTLLMISTMLIMLVLLYWSVTHTNKLEQALHRAEQAMNLRTLTATLAHEVRNPLSICRTAAELLKTELVHDPRAELTEDLLEELARIDQVLHEHLQPVAPQPEPTNITALLEQALDRVEPYLNKHHLKLERQFDPTTEIWGSAAPFSLTRLLENLLRNAVSASAPHNQIEIGLTADQRWVKLWLRDYGKGMSKSTLDRVMLPFYSESESGTGLGLALARRMIAEWGGALHLSSKRGKGAMVLLKFPVASKQA